MVVSVMWQLDCWWYICTAAIQCIIKAHTNYYDIYIYTHITCDGDMLNCACWQLAYSFLYLMPGGRSSTLMLLGIAAVMSSFLQGAWTAASCSEWWWDNLVGWRFSWENIQSHTDDLMGEDVLWQRSLLYWVCVFNRCGLILLDFILCDLVTCLLLMWHSTWLHCCWVMMLVGWHWWVLGWCYDVCCGFGFVGAPPGGCAPQDT